MTLGLMLFSTDPALIRPAVSGGVDAVVVDMERHGKEVRQRGADTVISADTLDDLVRVRGCTDARVICRVNAVGPWTEEEIDQAIASGADEVLLPMVRAPEDVVRALDAAAGRCGVGILLETRDAVERAVELTRLPVTRAYVGLNDLSIELGTPSLFTALTDGTLERLRAAVREIPFGFGGMTVPDGGSPVPALLLMGELVRLRADFTFLRRSFWQDVADRDTATAVREIREAAVQAAARASAAVAADRAALEATLAVTA
jgi:hypothetical protein